MTPARWAPLEGSALAVALEVLRHGPLSRSDLARRLDLSRGSLTRLSRPLVDAGLLVELEGPGTSGSRPLDVATGRHRFVGVKVTADAVHAVATDLRARTLAVREQPLVGTSPADVVEAVAGLVTDLDGDTTAGGGAPVTAVGVGVGGLVEGRSRVRSARYLRWEDVDLGELLSDRLGLPVVVDNDVLSLARAEQWFGAAGACDHFAVLTIGEGVGYALVVHDRVVAGPDAGVGLLGHVPLAPTGPTCPLGHVGCADAMLTVGGVEARASVALRRPVAYADVLALAAAGDPAAARVVEDAARALGRLVALVANTTMPQKVVVSGDGVALAETGRAALLAAVAADRDPRARDVDVDVQAVGFAEWARGAAVTAIQTSVLGSRVL
ncbi:ROK family transcriptional regulator [Pseudokineococcus marinus]|uniref:ROK family transcriptional regulator n=2 Tax=Pseudokineococcus marinus TaxID=351215 RepID=UPI002ADE2CE3|nr:ROK family transcriptional regulator [Pseudokineococcus marinus]